MLVTIVAALVLVIGGALAASGQIGAGRIGTGQAPSAFPSDGPGTDDATEGATTEDETTDASAVDETTDEPTEDDTTEDDTTEDDTTEDDTTEDDTTEEEESDGAESDAASPKAPCTLTSPPNRTGGATDADRHPGWTRGRHLGWCVAAAHRGTDGKAGSEKQRGKSGRADTKATKKPHPGKGHGKRH